MNKEYENIKLKIDQHLKTFFSDGQNEYENNLNEVINYSLLSGGKRLRPILLYKTTELFKGDLDIALNFACAIEMIHTYSLIHDDLPAMDNDDYRRGQLTSHVKFSEALAILAGDALLNKAYEILVKECVNKNIAKASAIISEYSGNNGMVVGQVADILTENIDIDISVLDYIIENKTAGLIIAPVLSGATLSGVDDINIKHLEEFAYHIGFSFQIIDDILDITGDEKKLGKKTKKDEKLGKNTYLKYYGVEESKIIAEKHLKLATESIKKVQGIDIQFYIDLISFLKNREKQEKKWL